MAFDAIDSDEIEVGKPIKKSLFTKVKDNFDDLDSRVTAIDQAIAGATPIILSIPGEYATLSTEARVHVVKTTISADIVITAVTLYVDVAGVVGTTTVDVLTATPGGSYSTALTALPSIGFGSGDDATAAGTMVDDTSFPATTGFDVDDGDIITLSITSAQSEAEGLYVRIDYVFRT